jgi:hypothetical protein
VDSTEEGLRVSEFGYRATVVGGGGFSPGDYATGDLELDKDVWLDPLSGELVSMPSYSVDVGSSYSNANQQMASSHRTSGATLKDM